MADTPQAEKLSLAVSHASVQPCLDDFLERIDSHTTDLAAWTSHALSRGSNVLRAAYRHDRDGFCHALGTFAKEVFHAAFHKIAPQLQLAPTIEEMADDYAATEAGKLYDNICTVKEKP